MSPLCRLIGLILLLISVTSNAAEPSTAVIDRFLLRCRNDQSLNAAAQERVVAAVTRHRDDPKTATATLMAGLREVSPDFAAATQLLADSDLEQAILKLTPFAESPNEFLRAEALFLAGRALAQQERFEEAMTRFLAIEPLRNSTIRSPEAALLRIKCLAGMLKFEEAMKSYKQFRTDHPDAPPRLLKEAEALMIDIEEMEFDLLSNIHTKMNYSRRRLGLSDSSQPTQAVQEEVVALLTEMIDELEKKSGNCKGCKCAGGKKPGAGSGGSPGISNVTPGNAQITERDGTRAAWVDLKRQASEPTSFNGLKTRLPSQYKDLVEQYYRSFQDKKAAP